MVEATRRQSRRIVISRIITKNPKKQKNPTEVELWASYPLRDLLFYNLFFELSSFLRPIFHLYLKESPVVYVVWVLYLKKIRVYYR